LRQDQRPGTRADGRQQRKRPRRSQGGERAAAAQPGASCGGRRTCRLAALRKLLRRAAEPLNARSLLPATMRP
jgi:hypothetical protein